MMDDDCCFPMKVTEEHFAEIDKAIARLSVESLVPLFVERGDTAVVHGTGTLFAIGEAKFIVTARHVIQLAQKSNLKIHFVGTKNGNNVLCQSDGMTVWHKESQEEACRDVAFWKLSEREAPYFAGRTFIRLENIDRPPFFEESLFCIVGFPTVLTKPLTRGTDQENVVEAIRLHTRPYDGQTASFFAYDADIHILTRGGSDTIEVVDGHTTQFPNDLHGISGGQIWRWSYEFIDGECRVEFALHAIQTGTYRNHSIIKGTRWLNVLDLVFQVWPELRRASTLVVPNSKVRRRL